MSKTIAMLVASGLLAGGCAVQTGSATTQPSTNSTTLQQQLQTAELALAAAQGVVAVLEAGNVIKPAAAAQIQPFEQAAAAALAQAAKDVAAGDANAQTSLDALTAATAAYSQAMTQSKSVASSPN